MMKRKKLFAFGLIIAAIGVGGIVAGVLLINKAKRLLPEEGSGLLTKPPLEAPAVKKGPTGPPPQ